MREIRKYFYMKNIAIIVAIVFAQVPLLEASSSSFRLRTLEKKTGDSGSKKANLPGKSTRGKIAKGGIPKTPESSKIAKQMVKHSSTAFSKS
jgi:hypothetical protein